MRWLLKNYLAQNDLTPYQLVKTTGLSANTIYPLARGETQRISLDTLQTVLDGLDSLTGKQVNVTDILERETEEYEFPNGVPDDIRERIKDFEQSDKKGTPLRDIAAKYDVNR